MRVVHYLQAVRLEHGGVVRAVLDLTGLLARRGVEIVLLTHDDRDAPDDWKAGRAGCPQVVPLGPAGRLGRLGPGQLARAGEQLAAADLLHIHACWHLANNQLARLAGRMSRPYVQSIHGMLDDWSMAQSTLKKKLFLKAGGLATLEGAAVLHCTAEAELQQARRWFGRNAAAGRVAPLVFDLEPYRELPAADLARAELLADLQPDEPLVLFLARVHYKKGVDVFIRTMGELFDRGVRCRAAIAGAADEPAYMEAMRRLAAEVDPGGRIAFLGMVTGEVKTSLFRLAHVFLGPTSQENFGFVFPESLACGTPVVTTRGVDIHPELAASGGAVIVDRTPAAFADAAAAILADPACAQAMGAAGRRWVFEHLAPDTVAARYEQMYADVVAGNRGGSRRGQR